METIHTKTRTSLPPEHVIHTFRHTYTYEEVQDELWRIILPRLLDSFKERNPDHTNHIAAFYENIEVLISAVYQLPNLSATPEGAAPLTTNPTGDHRHG